LFECDFKVLLFLVNFLYTSETVYENITNIKISIILFTAETIMREVKAMIYTEHETAVGKS